MSFTVFPFKFTLAVTSCVSVLVKSMLWVSAVASVYTTIPPSALTTVMFPAASLTRTYKYFFPCSVTVIVAEPFFSVRAVHTEVSSLTACSVVKGFSVTRYSAVSMPLLPSSATTVTSTVSLKNKPKVSLLKNCFQLTVFAVSVTSGTMVSATPVTSTVTLSVGTKV